MLSTRTQNLLMAGATTMALALIPTLTRAGVVVTDGRIAHNQGCTGNSDTGDTATGGRATNTAATTASATNGAPDLDTLTEEELQLYLFAAAIFNGPYRDNSDGAGPVPASFDDATAAAYIIGNLGGDSAGGCAATPGVGLAALAALGLLLARRRRP